MCSQFVTVGGNGIYLTDIVLDVGDDTITAQSGVKIQILDENGYMTSTYTYHKGDKTRGYTTDGWYKGATLIKKGTANDYFFELGTGIWFGGKEGYNFQTSGEVVKDAPAIPLINGNLMIANPYPVSVNLTTLVMDVGSDVITAQSGVKIQILDENGYMTSTYTYHKGDKTRGYTTDGWYKGATLIKASNDYAIKPGEALWFGGKEGYTVKFPAIDL